MAKLNEAQAERARTGLVEFILAVRRRYLKAYGSAVVMKHWDQIQGRVLSAARRSGTVDEWCTLVLRGLQLPTTLDRLGVATVWELAKTGKDVGHREELDIVERETGLLMAMARLIVENQRGNHATDNATDDR